MNSPVDPTLIQLVQQELKSLQDDVKNMSVECDEKKTKVQTELQNCANGLEELHQKMERLEIGQQNMKHRAGLTEKRVDNVEGRVNVVEENMSKREGLEIAMEHRAELTEKRVDDVEGRVSVVEEKMSKRDGFEIGMARRAEMFESRIGDVEDRVSAVGVCMEYTLEGSVKRK